jgi:hypothetical protein
MLVVSGGATAYLLFESFQQTSNARVARSEELAARACRDISDRYQFFVSGWGGGPVDDQLKQQLTAVVQSALANAIGVEGGIWQADAGSLAYAFPSYEGTGPSSSKDSVTPPYPERSDGRKPSRDPRGNAPGNVYPSLGALPSVATFGDIGQ